MELAPKSGALAQSLGCCSAEMGRSGRFAGLVLEGGWKWFLERMA